MILKTKDTGISCHFVIDFPLMKFGQKYLDDKDILDLMNHFDVPLSIWGISAEERNYSISTEVDLLLFSKSIFLLTSLKEKQHEYAKNRISKEIKLQEQIVKERHNKKNTKKDAQSPGPRFKSNPLQNAIHTQFSRPCPIPEHKAKNLMDSMINEKQPAKLKSSEQICSEVRGELVSLMKLADWMKTESSESILEWIEVLHDLMDQIMESSEFTDIDKYKFSVEVANNGKENLHYIAPKMEGKYNVLPKWLQKSGYQIGVIK